MIAIHNMRRVRVVTWNVGRLYSPRGNNRLDDADVPRVARTLWELDPDVVLLQELVTARQLGALLARLPGYDGRMSERCRYDRHVAALARTRLAPAFEQELLDETGRGLVAVTFALAVAPPGFAPAAKIDRGVAMAVHFDVFHPGRRRSQARDVRALVDERAEPVVAVGGDFNLDPDWAERLGHHEDVRTFRLLSDRLTDTGRAAGPTLIGIGRVDHVLAAGARVRESFTCVSPNRRLPLGDHDPLVCDLHLS
jgi:endonuclease/exonuclease/phosphatase family metal-dependent hydrolase